MFFESKRKKQEIELRDRMKAEHGIEVYKERTSIIELEEQGFQKVPAEMAGQLSQIFQFAPQIAVDKINTEAVGTAFDLATKDTYRAILDPGTYLAKSKKTTGAVRGSELSVATNKVAGQAEWMPNNSVLSVSNAPQVALGVFNMASMVTGQYFMSQINTKLSDMKEGLERIEKFLESGKRSQLKANLRTLEKIYNTIGYIQQSSEQRQATILQLKMIQKESLELISFYEESIKAKKLKEKDKEKIITENIDAIHKEMMCCQYATLSYSVAVSLEVYLTDIFDEEYLNIVYKDMEAVIEQYKGNYLFYESELKNYLEVSKVLNKRSPIQLVADATVAIGTMAVTRNSLAIKATELVDDSFNEKREKVKQKEKAILEEKTHQWKATSDLEMSLESVKNYISFTKSRFEVVQAGEDIYVRYGIEDYEEQE